MSETNNPLSPQSALPQLEIVEGLHHGVRLALEENEYSVGLNAGSDIVLSDDGVLPNHAILHIERGEARVDAVGGDVFVGKLRVEAGHGCRVRMPVTVSIGAASLQLSPAPGAHGPLVGIRSTMNRLIDNPVRIAGGVLACALVAAVAAPALQQPPPAGARLAGTNTLDHSFSEIRDAARLREAALSATLAEAASEELAGKLKDAGINTIQVTASDGRIAAEGSLSEQQAPGWASIQRWFDTKYASSAVLTANVAIGPMAGPPPVRLQAVWFGQRPYIISDNGSRYYEGAVLESGWVVTRIGEDRVILGKDSESLALTYR